MDSLRKNIISQQEFAVLSILSQKMSDSSSQTIEINELSTNTGIRDNDEVLRALYTLEGRNFVVPEPPGSFTSNNWKITDAGVKALSVVKSEIDSK